MSIGFDVSETIHSIFFEHKASSPKLTRAFPCPTQLLQTHCTTYPGDLTYSHQKLKKTADEESVGSINQIEGRSNTRRRRRSEFDQPRGCLQAHDHGKSKETRRTHIALLWGSSRHCSSSDGVADIEIGQANVQQGGIISRRCCEIKGYPDIVIIGYIQKHVRRKLIEIDLGQNVLLLLLLCILRRTALVVENVLLDQKFFNIRQGTTRWWLFPKSCARIRVLKVVSRTIEKVAHHHQALFGHPSRLLRRHLLVDQTETAVVVVVGAHRREVDWLTWSVKYLSAIRNFRRSMPVVFGIARSIGSSIYSATKRGIGFFRRHRCF